LAGADEVFAVSALTGEGIDALRARLEVDDGRA
jgi:ethanolamine utilization protein EutP (predicted NTPase)